MLRRPIETTGVFGNYNLGRNLNDKWFFTADQEKPQLAVIDTATNKIETWISAVLLWWKTLNDINAACRGGLPQWTDGRVSGRVVPLTGFLGAVELDYYNAALRRVAL